MLHLPIKREGLRRERGVSESQTLLLLFGFRRSGCFYSFVIPYSLFQLFTHEYSQYCLLELQGISARDTSNRILRLIRKYKPLMCVLWKLGPMRTAWTVFVLGFPNPGVGRLSLLMVTPVVSYLLGGFLWDSSHVLSPLVVQFISLFLIIAQVTGLFMLFIMPLVCILSVLSGQSFLRCHH